MEPVPREGLHSGASDCSSTSELSVLLQAFFFLARLRKLLPILYYVSFALLPNAKCGCLAKNRVAFFLLSFLSSELF